eukprot:1719347-Amphidinium_carterae.1
MQSTTLSIGMFLLASATQGGQHVPWPQHSGYPQAAVPSQVQAASRAHLSGPLGHGCCQACHAHTQPAGAARTFAVLLLNCVQLWERSRACCSSEVNGVSGPCQAPVHPQSACQSRIGTSMDLMRDVVRTA